MVTEVKVFSYILFSLQKTYSFFGFTHLELLSLQKYLLLNFAEKLKRLVYINFHYAPPQHYIVVLSMHPEKLGYYMKVTFHLIDLTSLYVTENSSK